LIRDDGIFDHESVEHHRLSVACEPHRPCDVELLKETEGKLPRRLHAFFFGFLSYLRSVRSLDGFVNPVLEERAICGG
jgi:hypothetical protein